MRQFDQLWQSQGEARAIYVAHYFYSKRKRKPRLIDLVGGSKNIEILMPFSSIP